MTVSIVTKHFVAASRNCIIDRTIDAYKKDKSTRAATGNLPL